MLAKIAISAAAIIIWLLIMYCMIVASDEDDWMEEQYWNMVEDKFDGGMKQWSRF